METTAQPNQNPASQPDGIEVKLNLSKTAVCEILLYFLAMFASSALYIYIWEEFSSFNWGHFIGLHYGKSVLQLLLAIVGLYILLYSLLGYFINGRSLKGLRWVCDWKSIGLTHPSRPLEALPPVVAPARYPDGPAARTARLLHRQCHSLRLRHHKPAMLLVRLHDVVQAASLRRRGFVPAREKHVPRYRHPTQLYEIELPVCQERQTNFPKPRFQVFFR